MYVRYHFVVVYIYAGTINRPLQQLVFCHNVANGLPTTQRTLPKHPTNTPKRPTFIPQGVGADSSCPCPCITKYTFLHYQIHIFISSHTYVHILKYVYSNRHTRIFVPHFVVVYIYAGTINRPLQQLVFCHNVANGLPTTQRTLPKHPTNTPKRPTFIPPGVGADSSCPYPYITKYAFLHYQIRIFVPHFVVVYIYAGTINRPLQQLVFCHNVANGLPTTQRTLPKHPTNTPKRPTFIPQGVGADSSCPCPCITKYTFLHYQIHIFISSHTYVHILKYVYSNRHTRIFVPHFVVVYIYAGTINRPLQQLVFCHNVANGLPTTQRIAQKNATFTLRKPYYCNTTE